MTNDIAQTVETITPVILKRAFARWQRAQEPPAELLRLKLLSGAASQSRTVKTIFLYDFIFDIVVDRLRSLRELAGIPHPDQLPVSRQALMALLARDFAAGQQNPAPELAAWSALFHRFLLPVQVPPRALAEAAGISERHLRRHLALGLRYLAGVLRRFEWAACQQPGEHLLAHYLSAVGYRSPVGAERFLK